jgi:membrane protease YdiL (CAAX protease family)
MNDLQQHSLWKSIALHLIPGASGTTAYVLMAPALMDLGYPSMLALLLSAFVVIMPIEIGVLLWAAKQETGRFTIRAILRYSQPLPKWQYVVLPFGLVVWGFLVQGITPLLDNAVASAWFGWLPDWFFVFDAEQFASMSEPVLWLTAASGLILNGILFPYVEELYFRGYLLPRIERFGKWAPGISASLFSLYHFWTPWQFFSRIVWALPWVYTAWKKRSISLIIITHCLANTAGWLLTFALILGQ